MEGSGYTEQSDKAYSGSIPARYDRYLGPMLFAPYAADIAARAKAFAPLAVLETAAGTGIVTERLAEVLSDDAVITATDLNQAMIDTAVAKITSPKVTWQVCDATRLPFADGSFDMVLCQFGVMFFPSKPDAFNEARRVLKPGGTFLFNVWDKIEFNPITLTVADTIAARYPADPPNYPRRTPYGHHDVELISRQLGEAGFRNIVVVVVTLPTGCPSPHEAAMAQLQGSPMSLEIEARDPTGLAAATEAAAAALAVRFGKGPIASTMQAIVFTATA
jgi:ubiquinone/menaquinone biosynthesis C-methylase UbiE